MKILPKRYRSFYFVLLSNCGHRQKRVEKQPVNESATFLYCFQYDKPSDCSIQMALVGSFRFNG